MALILTGRVADGPFHIINEDTGQDTLIDIIEVKGSQVRISFTASDNITILRDKVFQENHRYD